MRALIISHTYLPAFNQKKLALLARLGAEIALFAPANWKNLGGLFHGQPASLEKGYDSFRYYAAWTLRPGHVASYLFAPSQLAHALDDFRPDLVQVEQEVYSFVAAQAALAAWRRKVRTVVFSWENLDRTVHPLQRLARRIALRHIHGIISGNHAGAELMRRWGFRGKLTVIPQVGVDPHDFPSRSSAPDNGEFTVGYVGRLVLEKGVNTLLEAVKILASRGRQCNALICGAGPNMRQWQEAARTLGIAERVTWQDSLPHRDVAGIMARMNVLVLPSITVPHWAEQFGLVLAQAMTMSLPVLGSNSGAIPEVIGRDDCIFPQGDALALAAKLQALIDDPQRRAELSAYSRERARQHFQGEIIARRTVDFWQEVLTA